MLKINGFRSVGTALVSAGAILSSAAAWAQPLALNDPNPRFPASIFQQVMPEESTVAEPDEAKDRVPAHLRRQVVNYSGREGAGTIVIDTPNTYLYYVLGSGKAVRYGIGVGREGFTWSGVQSITRKTEWPDWVPPAEMLQRQPYLPRFMAGGPGNPLGARAMYLGNTIYRIHGTNAPSTIGGRVSSGCIRMLNEDVMDLFSRVTLGTKVVVLPMGARNVPMAESPRERQAPARVSINTVRGVY
jgi:lipoprotein-anchoring transpeptidase ErfK/SrfK